MTPDPARHALRRRPMFTPLYAALGLAVVAVAVLGWLVWPQSPAMVIVVRHAEKAAGDDPVLSAAGRARAAHLAEMLAPAGISAIYATPTRRARQTAAPLAERLSLPIQEYDAEDPDALVRTLGRRTDGAVLVIGHSNTVPALVRRIGGRDIGTLDEDRYGDVFLIVKPRWGKASVIRQYQSVEK